MHQASSDNGGGGAVEALASASGENGGVETCGSLTADGEKGGGRLGDDGMLWTERKPLLLLAT